jgi:hypothetical protein
MTDRLRIVLTPWKAVCIFVIIIAVKGVSFQLSSMATDGTLEQEPDKAPLSAETTVITESAAQSLPGILVTAELEKAIEECNKKVIRIAKACRASNKKFRFVYLHYHYYVIHTASYPGMLSLI